MEHNTNDVWNAIDDLRNSFTEIKGGFSRMDARMEALMSSIKSTQENVQMLQTNQRTPWGNVIAGVGVMLSVILAIGGAAMAPLYISDANTKDIVMQQETRMRVDDERERLDAANLARHDGEFRRLEALILYSDAAQDERIENLSRRHDLLESRYYRDTCKKPLSGSYP